MLAVGVAGAQLDLAAVRGRAEQGDPEALNALGNAFTFGQGVAQDYAEGLRLYRKAAERGLGAAEFNLAMAYELGRGVPADLAAAFTHYFKAAEAGFAPAQFNVGNMYANGQGVAQDHFEAVLWLRRGAEAGLAEAQYNLGHAYELGRGITKDEAAARKWYRLAAGQNYPRACYNLALMLEEGRGGEVDLAAAHEFYGRAAAQNYAPAQNNLGILLAEGRGVPADLTQAYAWLALAAENGAKPTGRDMIAQHFSSAQLAEANAAVGKLRAQVQRGAVPAGETATGEAPVAVAVGEAELKARLAAAQTELAELLVEYGRVTSVAQSLGREKSALEKQLEAIAGRPADLPPVPPVPTVPAPEFTAKLERLQNALDDARAENARLTAAIESAQRDRLAFDERLATAAALLQRERTNFQERLAAAESKVIVDRAPVAATNFPDPAVEPLRAQVAQLTRDTAALRAEKEQMQSHLAELTARLAAAKAAPTAPAASRNAAVASGALPVVGDVRIAQLIADNARLNDEVRRSIIQLSAMNHQLRAAQVKAGQATATVPAEPASGNAP